MQRMRIRKRARCLMLPAVSHSPHHWTYEDRFYAIDENLERADGPFVEEGKGSVNRVALHHYVTKCVSCRQPFAKQIVTIAANSAAYKPFGRRQVSTWSAAQPE